VFAIFVGLVVVGVGLLALQSFGGHDVDTDGDLSGGFDHDGADHDGPLTLLLNLRFWAFACAGAGGIGTLGLWLTDTSRAVVAVVAAMAGIAIGLLATWVLHRLQQNDSTSIASVGTSQGRVGRVVLAISEGGRGKVRLEIKGTLVDVVARADGPLEAGAEVVVTEIDGSEAHVTRVPSELSS